MQSAQVAEKRRELCIRGQGDYRARSRLYRSQILQVNTRWKALAEIYTMHSFVPFYNLGTVKVRKFKEV